MSDSDKPYVISVPDRSSRYFRDYTRTDWYVTVIMACLVIITLVKTNALVSFIPALLYVVLMYRKESARVYDLACRWSIDWVLDALVRRGMRWNKELLAEPKPGLTSKVKRKAVNLVYASTPVPVETFFIGPIGVAYLPDKDVDAIVITGEGSSIQAKEPIEMVAILDRIADGIKEVASMRNHPVGISFRFGKRPLNRMRLAAQFGQSIHPDIVKVPKSPQPEDTDYDRRMRNLQQLTGQLLETTHTYGRDPAMVLVITLPSDGTLRNLSKGQRISRQQFEELPIKELAEIAVEGLENAGISNPRIMGRDELSDYIRRAWDLAHIEEYDQERWETPEVLPALWPEDAIAVTSKSCVTDDTHHSVIRVRSSREMVPPDFYFQLHATPGVDFIDVTTAGVCVRANREGRHMARKANLRQGMREARGIVDNSPAAADQARKDHQRRQQLHESVYKMDYIILVGVSATSEVKLNQQRKRVMRQIRKMGLEGKHITGRTHQLDALWTSCLGINLM